MATDGQRLRAKAHDLPRGHNSKQHKCYDIFVFFGFKGKHFLSPSQQVSQNIFAVRVERVIVSKKQVCFSPTPPHFPQKRPFLFFQLATHRPRPHSRPTSFLEGAPPLARTYAYAPTSPSFALFAFTLHPLSQATIYQVLTTKKQGEHKAKKAFTPSAPNDKPCVGS